MKVHHISLLHVLQTVFKLLSVQNTFSLNNYIMQHTKVLVTFSLHLKTLFIRNFVWRHLGTCWTWPTVTGEDRYSYRAEVNFGLQSVKRITSFPSILFLCWHLKLKVSDLVWPLSSFHFLYSQKFSSSSSLYALRSFCSFLCATGQKDLGLKKDWNNKEMETSYLHRFEALTLQQGFISSHELIHNLEGCHDCWTCCCFCCQQMLFVLLRGDGCVLLKARQLGIKLGGNTAKTDGCEIWSWISFRN